MMTNKKNKPTDTPEEKPETEQPETVETEIVPEEAPVAAPAEEEPLREQLLRLKADFDNFRKRTQRERNDLFVLANESLFLEILPVIDHFEMGLKSARDQQTENSVTEGFQLVYNQLLDLLKKFNVTPIDAVGETFNPHLHEALTHMPSDLPSETVTDQIRRGYRLGEKLLRAAQVVVSSGPAQDANEGTSE